MKNGTQMKHLGMLLTIALLLSAGCATGPPTPDGSVFLGYYFGSAAEDMPPNKITYEPYTHICHAFLLAKPNGSVIFNDYVPSRELTDTAHKAGVKVILSLGGWGSDDYYTIMAKAPEALERHVSETMAVVEEYGYDGIDLDWEYPDSPEEAEAFAYLTREFRKRMDALGERTNQKYELTMAVTASDYAAKWLDRDLLLENMDFLNVMTYDFAGPWSAQTGHNAPLFASPNNEQGSGACTTAGMEYWHETRNMPKDHLAVGIPLYGRGFVNAKPYEKADRDTKNPYVSRTYRGIQELLDGGWRREWDNDSRVPFAFAPDGSAFIGYDDARSVAEKARWARENGYRGVFFWAINQDRMADGTHPLQEAAHQAWSGGGD